MSDRGPRRRTASDRSMNPRTFFAASALMGALTVAPASHAAPASESLTSPQLLEPLEPTYPTTGTSSTSVLLRITVNERGTVTKVEVVRGDEPYASAAVRAAWRGRFSPAKRGDRSVEASILVAVDFTFSARESGAPDGSDVPVVSATDDASSGDSAMDLDVGDAEVVVSVSRVDATERSIQKAEARLMAGTFGDPLRAVELLPGITPVISGVPFFFVRGAPTGSVNFYLDESKVPQLYHVGPGSSVLHPQFVEGVALRAGPYPARYGDATSGVVTTQLISDAPLFGAEAEAKVFESSGYVGGPVLDGNGSVAAAGKVSHLGPVLELTNPDLRLNYWDYQALAAYRLPSGDQLSLLVLGASDYVAEEEDGVLDINLDAFFHRLKLRYTGTFANGVDLQSYLIFGLEGSRLDADDEEFKARSAGGGLLFSHVVSEDWQWASGISIEATDYDASGAPEFIGEASNISVSRVDTQGALWAEARLFPAGRVSADASVRGAMYRSVDNTELALEPRLSSTLRVTEDVKSILAVGYSTQSPSFTVPTSAVRPAGLRGGLQRAFQSAATLRYALPFVVTAEATLFYNRYSRLSDPLSLTTVPDPLEVGDLPSGGEPPSEDLNFDDRPNGQSYGLELMLRRPFSNALSGTLAYTLSRSTRRIGGTDVPSSFDRTHTLNATLGYDLGNGFNVGARLLLYSGLPVRSIGETGGRTGDRSEPFVRLDFRLSKEWTLSWGKLMLIAEMLNATFQEEILGVSCAPEGCISATFGPLTVPSVGLRGTFGEFAD